MQTNSAADRVLDNVRDSERLPITRRVRQTVPPDNVTRLRPRDIFLTQGFFWTGVNTPKYRPLQNWGQGSFLIFPLCYE